MLHRRFLLTLVVLSAIGLRADAQAVRLSRGMVITRSTRIIRDTYRLSATESTDSAVITVRGDNVTVDFAGSALVGTAPEADPDQAKGVAIRIDGGRNVRILNANIRGYKIGILARGTRNLELRNNNLSYNWKPRLYSGVEHESLMDWLSHHNNEKDEWMRYGAAVYLTDVKTGTIKGNRIEQGMEGLMLVRSDSMSIWNNVIEFNSGVGIALYRSSYNRIMHNYASFNVRGYSNGFYRRGQDSADLLLYEQSCHNVVAFNSMTHGGDGLFLWAGQSTMDTGTGGSNDNLFYRNDFSFAPTNAMEATFSRNVFIANRAHGSEYGLWGGYSFESTVIGNDFGYNRTGIAIEHGQNNELTANRFLFDSTAIRLWAVPEEPGDWGYPKHRDTKSRDYRIERNLFLGNRTAMRVAQTANAHVVANEFIKVDSLIVRVDSSQVDVQHSDTSALYARIAPEAWPPEAPAWTAPKGIVLPKPLAGGLDPARDRQAKLPRSAIIVDDWGPYDYRYPRLWPRDTSYATPLALQVLGPRGRWRVIAQSGISSVSKVEGAMNDTVEIVPTRGFEDDWTLSLEYRGAVVVSSRGARTAGGSPYVFSYSRFNPVREWDVAFYALADSIGQRTPIATVKTSRLDWVWYRPSIAGLPQSNFRMEARTEVNLRPGSYQIRTISDDAMRVWVDDKPVIDNRKPHESEVNTAPISSGQHTIRVEYYQLGGWVEIRAEIIKSS
ncbi:MAG TPA: right-handed parallel beta-helix repeat-containing protein [Gemmatimonadaceae bacterium]|nr:right-handed parallel beta-helix repeat-containing protein [Gemmatimonadaceae bacterium]